MKSLKKLLRPIYEPFWKAWELHSYRPTGDYPVVIQGIQRSGTNYLTTLLTQSNYRVINRIDPKRNAPTHKHFRWQNDKSTIVMDDRYYNSKNVKSLNEINNICGYPDDYKHIIVFRVPDKWLESIYSWGLESNWFRSEDDFFSKELSKAYFNEWDNYYAFWQNIALQTPDQVLLINHEQLVADPINGLLMIDKFMGVHRQSDYKMNTKIDKVRHSKPISTKRDSIDVSKFLEFTKLPSKFDWHKVMGSKS